MIRDVPTHRFLKNVKINWLLIKSIRTRQTPLLKGKFTLVSEVLLSLSPVCLSSRLCIILQYFTAV